MASLPPAPVLMNPNPPSATNYEQRFSNIGSKVSNVAQQAGNLYDKVQAYGALKEKMKNVNEFKKHLLSEVTNAMVKNGYSGDSINKVQSAFQLMEPDEALQKSVAFVKATKFYEENKDKLPQKPMFGEKSYTESMAPQMEKALTAQQIEAMGTAKTQGEAYQAGTKETSEALATGAKQYAEGLPTLKDEKKYELELSKLRLQAERLKAQAKRYGAQAIEDEIAGLNTAYDNTLAGLKLDEEEIKSKRKLLADIEKGVASEGDPQEILREIAIIEARKDRLRPQLDKLQVDIEEINDIRLGRGKSAATKRESGRTAPPTVGQTPGPTNYPGGAGTGSRFKILN